MGNVRDHPGMDDLMLSETGKLMSRFKEYVDSSCSACSHIRYCRGGCPYNAMAPTPGEIRGVDPHCIAYKRIFGEINDRMNKEMFDTPVMETESFGRASQRKPVKPGVMALMRSIVSR